MHFTMHEKKTQRYCLLIVSLSSYQCKDFLKLLAQASSQMIKICIAYLQNFSKITAFSRPYALAVAGAIVHLEQDSYSAAATAEAVVL